MFICFKINKKKKKSLTNFADIYAAKLGFKREILLQTLWGDYFLNAKTKRIMKNAQVLYFKRTFALFHH